jgi:hypothetical protein
MQDDDDGRDVSLDAPSILYAIDLPCANIRASYMRKCAIHELVHEFKDELRLRESSMHVRTAIHILNCKSTHCALGQSQARVG